MSEPYIKCPCGFEARTADAAALFKAHTCPQSPHLMWAFTSVMLGFLTMVVLVAWMVS